MRIPDSRLGSRGRVQRLAPDFGGRRRQGIYLANGCCCCCCLQMLTVGGAGILSGSILGVSIIPDAGRAAKARTAVLAAVGGLFLGGYVGLVQMSLDMEYSAPWWTLLFIVTLPSIAIGGFLIGWDTRRGTFGALASRRKRAVWSLVAAAGLAFATYCATAVTSGEPLAILLASIFPLVGGGLSFADQKRARNRASCLETYLMALLFGAVLAPGLTTFLEYESMPGYFAVLIAGVVVGTCASALRAYRGGAAMSLTGGIFNGFVTGFLFVAVYVWIEELPYGGASFLWMISGAVAGGLVAFLLGRDLAKSRGQRVILTPVILSPLPGALVLGILSALFGS